MLWSNPLIINYYKLLINTSRFITADHVHLVINHHHAIITIIIIIINIILIIIIIITIVLITVGGWQSLTCVLLLWVRKPSTVGLSNLQYRTIPYNIKTLHICCMLHILHTYCIYLLEKIIHRRPVNPTIQYNNILQ